jgi:hypothetical protein
MKMLVDFFMFRPVFTRLGIRAVWVLFLVLFFWDAFDDLFLRALNYLYPDPSSHTAIMQPAGYYYMLKNLFGQVLLLLIARLLLEVAERVLLAPRNSN